MFITPEDVKEYTVFKKVKERPENLLEMDILEAEKYVEKELNRPLNDFIPIPNELKLALIKVTQFFSLANSDEAMIKGYKSEKLGDYSYTLSDGTSMTMPDISDLISEFIDRDETEGNVFIRVRSL